MLLTVMSVFVGGADYVLSSLLTEHALHYDNELLGYGMIAAAPYLYVIAELLGCAAAVLLACVMLATLQGTVMILRAVLWRVIEYGKGPVAACAVSHRSASQIKTALMPVFACWWRCTLRSARTA